MLLVLLLVEALVLGHLVGGVDQTVKKSRGLAKVRFVMHEAVALEAANKAGFVTDSSERALRGTG